MLYVACQKLPVTAVATLRNLLVAAHGGFIEVYNISSGKNTVIDHLQIFKQSVIHDLKFYKTDRTYYLLIFGGKELSTAAITFAETDICKDSGCEILHTKLFSDWVHDVVLLKNEDDTYYQLAVALAHNTVVRYDWNSNCIIDEVHCPDKCILYSAHFLQSDGAAWSNVCVFSGTVFNQIIIWKPHLKNTDESCIIKRLIGHDGVIFDLQFDFDHQIIVSASDDRSVRVWDCSFLTTNTSSSSSDSCLCVLYGHEARIWKVKTFSKGNEVFITSAAEDGFCIIWKLSDRPNRFSASIARKFNFRANLLSLFVDESNDRFVVGGCDGSIRVRSFSKSLQTNCYQETISIDKDKLGVLKTIMLLTKQYLAVLAHTDKGVLLVYDLKHEIWRVLTDDSNFGSYAVLRVNKSETLAAIGSTKGTVKIFRLNIAEELKSCIKLQPFQSKILNIVWCENSAFVTGPSGLMNWYKISLDSTKQLQVDFVSSFILPNAKHRWATSVLLLESMSDALLCGDRRGSIHYYVKGSDEPIQTHHGAHGKLGVTSLVNYGIEVISTGRDGHWRVWSIRDCHLILLSKHRAAQGMEWLEGCDHVCRDGVRRLYVYGFHGNKFVVWSKHSGDQVFSILCGGGHRSWGFSIHAPYFVFLKAGRLNVAKVHDLVDEDSVVSSSFHTQHINCVRHLFSYQFNEEAVHFIATSGEDTKVFVSSLVRKNLCPRSPSRLRVHHVLDDHLSNVRCIASLPVSSRDQTTELLLLVGGGRAMLNLYKVRIFANNQWRDVSVEFITTYTCDVLGSEVRLMAVELWEEDEATFKSALACSDGKILVFALRNLREIEEIGSTREFNHCFLTMTRVSRFLVCGSTDGHLYVLTSSLDEVATFSCHQSGVNSITSCDVTIKDEKFFLMATGGDDNAIRVLLIRETESSLGLVSESCMKESHSAQVSGLRLEVVGSSIILTSASIDQRVIRWTVDIRDKQVTCHPVACHLTHVSDVASLDAWDGNYFVCGQGISHSVFASDVIPT